MKGPPIGNRYQIKAGWCKDGKTPRMITVDNVPSGYIRIPGIPAYMLGKKCLDLGLSPPPSEIGNAAFDLKGFVASGAV